MNTRLQHLGAKEMKRLRLVFVRLPSASRWQVECK